MKNKVFVLLSAGMIVAVFLGTSWLIKINTIECVSQYGPCSDYLDDKLSLIQKSSLKSTKSQVVNLLEEMPIVDEYNMQFEMPGTLTVNVKERKLSYSIKSEDRIFVTDSEGNIIAEAESTSLPGVWVDACSCLIGEKVDLNLLFSLEIAYDMNYQYGVSSGKLDNTGLVFELPSSTKVIFPTSGDRQVLMGALSVIQNQLNTERPTTRIEIDLRFRNPVVRYL